MCSVKFHLYDELARRLRPADVDRAVFSVEIDGIKVEVLDDVLSDLG